mmetsp:Transcript_20890/g.72048  ORF Transcript_20890/g.72048 Transcript_20890/m.72048 type:complete len:250 (+) Transcript_20890:2079-2828(+)
MLAGRRRRMSRRSPRILASPEVPSAKSQWWMRTGGTPTASRAVATSSTPNRACSRYTACPVTKSFKGPITCNRLIEPQLLTIWNFHQRASGGLSFRVETLIKSSKVMTPVSSSSRNRKRPCKSFIHSIERPTRSESSWTPWQPSTNSEYELSPSSLVSKILCHVTSNLLDTLCAMSRRHSKKSSNTFQDPAVMCVLLHAESALEPTSKRQASRQGPPADTLEQNTLHIRGFASVPVSAKEMPSMGRGSP